jgi:HK97 family phage prohead protease
MPYYITDQNPECEGWATVKEDGELLACHATKQDAIDQGVAVALAEDSTFEGERSERAEPDELRLGDFVEWDSSGGMARGRIEHIMTEGVLGVPDSDFSIKASEDDPAALIRIFRLEETDDGDSEWEETETLVGHRFSTLTKISSLLERSEIRQVDLTPPSYMRASARRGLEWHAEGLSGDGLLDRTVREARALAQGTVTAEKWVRLRAFLARHMVDFDAPAASPDHESFPSPGVVAIALWGGGTTKRSAQRAMDYAEGVIGRIEAENEGRAKGQALSKMETRVTVTDFEVREEQDGMHLTGYAARFNEASEPLPFREYIAPGAFKRSLQSRNDVKLLWNHDSSTVLGSTRAGTLKLTEDNQGLRVSAILPETQAGRDAKVLINRGDVTGFSFGFTVPQGGDSWNEDGTERTLNAVRLMEVSTGVAFPAYPTTNGTALVRGWDKVAERAEVDADALADALLKIENGEDISTDDRQLITTVLDKLSPVKQVEEPNGDLDMLALKKKKLELLMGL